VHPHELVPEGMYFQDTAQGGCCAELVADGFARFGKRDFVGWRFPSDNHFRWLTYDDVYWYTKRLLLGLRETGSKTREFLLVCADLSPAYPLFSFHESTVAEKKCEEVP
jgi:hypothetical protein